MGWRTMVSCGVLFGLFAAGCEFPLISDGNQEMRRIAIGSITGSGDLEKTYYRIKEGMKGSEVAAILGREPDTRFHGGTTSYETCIWEEENANISMLFAFRYDTGTAYSKSIVPILSHVAVGSITESGDLERKYNQIKCGMKGNEVAAILGREPNASYPGGPMNYEHCEWEEADARISVLFASRYDTGVVYS